MVIVLSGRIRPFPILVKSFFFSSRQLEEQNSRLRADAESAKAEEEAMMTEMESTGQAFEELQVGGEGTEGSIG